MKNLVFVLWLFITGYNVVNAQIPPLNQKILDFVKKNMGQTVDRGECWDLVAVPLYELNAKWDEHFVFGKPIDPEKDYVFPGDIIQFENVKLRYKIDGTIYTETMSQHTAVVYKVLERGYYEIAHQNTSEFGRKVGVSKLRLSDVTQGKLYFYRPQPK